MSKNGTTLCYLLLKGKKGETLNIPLFIGFQESVESSVHKGRG